MNAYDPAVVFAFIILGAWCLFLLFVIMDSTLTRRIKTPRLSVYEQRRESMADVLTYAVSAAPVTEGDVVSRELSVVINGLEQPVVSFPGYAVDLGAFSVPQDSSVVLRLVDVDDAGNRSEPAELTFVALDTLPPSAPGALGVSLVAETSVSDEVSDEETDESAPSA